MNVRSRSMIAATLAVTHGLSVLFGEAFACTWVTPVFQVKPSFFIEIVNDKQRVSEVSVQIHRVNRERATVPVFSGRTDAQGRVSIRNLDSGSYSVDVGEGVYSNSADLHVVDTPSDKSQPGFKLAWSRLCILRYGRFRGVLRAQDYSADEATFVPAEVMPTWAMKATSVRSGKVASFVTDSNGWFDLSGLEPGAYTVELVARWPRVDLKAPVPTATDSGSFPLEITNNMPADERDVDLSVSMTGCGLSYRAVPRK